MTIVNEKKKCIECCEYRDVGMFSASIKSNDGFMNKCIVCRFYEKFYIADNGCWNWIGATNSDGYGRISLNKIQIYAHIFSYEFHNNTFAGESCVLHKCDIPRCVNPDHLFLGTYHDNTIDMLLKDRCGRSKLTILQVEDIRNEWKATSKLKGDYAACKLAKKYGVNKNAIYKIVGNKTWNCINEKSNKTITELTEEKFHIRLSNDDFI